jgi:putative endonuclease
MTKHTEIGTNGERIAAKFLQNKGYRILAQNWRYGKKEVDIIAETARDLVFVEVKTRSGFAFGFPEEAVTPQKKAFLKTAAAAYFEAAATQKLLRFDIISILLRADTSHELHHIEDAFF